MRKDQIEIGRVYAVKVSGKIQPVKILRTREHQSPFTDMYGNPSRRTTQYLGINQNTGREIVIKSAARIRHPVPSVL